MRSPVLILVTTFYPESAISLVRLLREIRGVQALVHDHILPADVTENIRVIFTLTYPCCHLQVDTEQNSCGTVYHRLKLKTSLKPEEMEIFK